MLTGSRVEKTPFWSRHQVLDSFGCPRLSSRSSYEIWAADRWHSQLPPNLSGPPASPQIVSWKEHGSQQRWSCQRSSARSPHLPVRIRFVCNRNRKVEGSVGVFPGNRVCLLGIAGFEWQRDSSVSIPPHPKATRAGENLWAYKEGKWKCHCDRCCRNPIKDTHWTSTRSQSQERETESEGIKRPDVDKFPVTVLRRSFVVVRDFSFYLGSLSSPFLCGPGGIDILRSAAASPANGQFRMPVSSPLAPFDPKNPVFLAETLGACRLLSLVLVRYDESWRFAMAEGPRPLGFLMFRVLMLNPLQRCSRRCGRR